MKTRTTVTTTSVRPWEISGEELRTLLSVPKGARVFITVPGGGDWSNTNLDLDEVPIQIVSVVTETKTHES